MVWSVTRSHKAALISRLTLWFRYIMELRKDAAAR